MEEYLLDALLEAARHAKDGVIKKRDTQLHAETIQLTKQQWETIIPLLEKEKLRKTGSIPRTPGTPIGAPRPRRIQDVIGQLSFFEGRPEALRDCSDTDLVQFLQGQIRALQEIIEEQEVESRKIPNEWSRTRSLQDVARQLIDAANHASGVRGSSPEKIAKILSAWGTAIIPYLDDDEEHVRPFATATSFLKVQEVHARIRDAVRYANKRPGRAWRLLAEVADNYTRWTESYLADDPTESDSESLRKIRTKQSAKQLREKCVQFYTETRDRSPSVVPEFDRRWPKERQPSFLSEVEGSLQIQPRPQTPDPGQHEERGRRYEQQIPRIIHTAPTLPIEGPPTIREPIPRHPQPEVRSPSPEQPEDVSIIDIERRRLATLGKRTERATTPLTDLRAHEKESPDEKVQAITPTPLEAVEGQIEDAIATARAAEQQGYDPARHPEVLASFAQIGEVWPEDDPELIRKQLLEKRARRRPDLDPETGRPL
jgi:hypothetical protein